MALNEARLLKAALEYVEHLPAEHNVFSADGENAFLHRAPWAANTRCSSFIRLLLNECFDLDPKIFGATFGTLRPRAVDFARTVQAGLLPAATNIRAIRKGCLGFIAYGMMRNGFSGHSFIVAGTPEKLVERWGELEMFSVEVVDSSRTSHGVGDTRYVQGQGGPLELGGVGRGTMRIVAHPNGTVRGYSWSTRSDSEVMLNGEGQEMVFCALPVGWKQRVSAALEGSSNG